MHRLQIFTQSDTTFVKDGNFTFPAFDGESSFSLQSAMVAIGAVQIVGKDKTWNTKFNATEIALYLGSVQNREGISVREASQRWIRKHCLSQIVSNELPFESGKIDWQELQSLVESTVSELFPLCV